MQCSRIQRGRSGVKYATSGMRLEFLFLKQKNKKKSLPDVCGFGAVEWKTCLCLVLMLFCV